MSNEQLKHQFNDSVNPFAGAQYGHRQSGPTNGVHHPSQGKLNAKREALAGDSDRLTNLQSAQIRKALPRPRFSGPARC